MTVTTDLVDTWRSPRAAVRRHLARGVSEPFAFTLLLVFLILAFVGQWPAAAREAFLANEPSAAPRILGRGLAVLATIPLWYGLAALSRVVARAFGGKGTWYGARIALFWGLATISPLMLLQGLVQGMIGPGPALWLVNTVVGLGFLWLWLTMLHEVERG
ncbi:YIP1 family protein [Tabrizicola piscis]|uniref:YIP1 family protein n=1 Tax=Tabrizicola piscis TaxID=2494374 RepID=A0A3S8U224_9RHOB|nr:YIP1 family protein [Tabrizicola piscis]AZL57651.1 YIP1 family protein [Tabrizicola piscis]